MAEGQGSPANSAPTQPGSSRSFPASYRRGRFGRGRGRGSHGRGGAQTPLATGDVSSATLAEASPAPAEERSSTPAGPRGWGLRGVRDRRGRPRRGRGGRAAQNTQVAPRRAFGGHLTSEAAQDALDHEQGLSPSAPEFVPGQTVQQKPKKQSKPTAALPQPRLRRGSNSEASGLTTRIHQEIDSGEYECAMCCSEVVRTSRIWACNLCWTVAHHQCTKKWHSSQMKEGAKATWRCPGCNSKLTEDPGTYHCWCGKEINPRPTPGLPPHSCGQTCSKPRGKCPHPCGLQCHAGPCPPCPVLGPLQSCYCGKNTSQTRCADTDYNQAFSCNETCEDLLPCGEHTCPQKCHPGVCGACDVLVPSTCYCGKEHKEMPCDQRDDILESYNYGEPHSSTDGIQVPTGSWFKGSFDCHRPCNREFDCGVHQCQKECHPHDQDTAHCPLSPDMITHCPCGKTLLEEIMTEPRQSCSDKIEPCTKTCGKALACGHQCQNTCHTGSCKPCLQMTDIACRCGRTTVETTCYGVPSGSIQKPWCFRTCRALLNCGRHQCDSRCCPEEKMAIKRQAARRRGSAIPVEFFEDEHICTRTCGRLLKCGQHFCQQLCHKGACPSCLEAIFDEISCSCGRTTLYPPQPCGTQPPQCVYMCTRARACGHPQVEHQCHPDSVECPKCPFLVEKKCVCGKEVLRAQPCWFAEARCGRPCGKRLKCGSHFCKLQCHRGDCEDAGVPGNHCSQPCGKARESCGHEDLDQCHAPFECQEEKPCQSETFITCDCQRRKQKVRCLSTRLEPRGPQREPLKCDDECSRQKRNRQLAEALNVEADHTDDHIPYQQLALNFFRDNTEWAQAQEREFRLFADSNGRYLRFQPMKPHQRQFLHVLAEDYGMDSESQDPEPHRHVSIFKGSRFVSAPRKSLAQCLRILEAQARATTTPSKPVQQQPPFNAILLSRPRFGLTTDEVDAALAPDANAAALSYTTTFLPTDEVIIRATPRAVTIASIASGASGPQAAQIEALRSKIARAGLAGAVLLCAVDPATDAIVRRQGGDKSGNGNGWNTVASRAVTRPKQWASAPVVQPKPTGFLALRKLGGRKTTMTVQLDDEEGESSKDAEDKDGVKEQAEEE